MADGSSPDVSTLAAGAIGIVAAAAAIYGGYTGTLARLSRNSEWTIPVAIGLTFLAIVLSFTAGRLPSTWSTESRRPWWTIVLVALAVVIAAIAAIVVTAGISKSLGTTDRPRITAKWTTIDKRTVLSATVSAQGLQTDDEMAITAVRLLNNGEVVPSSPPSPDPTYSPTPRPHTMTWAGIVYQQFVGPDIDGNVSVPLEVPLPPGYSGIMIVASTTGDQDCPRQAPTTGVGPNDVRKVEAPNYACLFIDAPWEAASPTASASNSTTSSR